MKEFYLMRHGQTRFNVQHRLQGVCDAPLTEVGIEQAKKAGQYLVKQEPIFDHVFTSTSERASDTLEIVTGRTCSVLLVLSIMIDLCKHSHFLHKLKCLPLYLNNVFR